jgi:tRNA(Ser,Leu) C12 N-acetylase TAN1
MSWKDILSEQYAGMGDKSIVQFGKEKREELKNEFDDIENMMGEYNLYVDSVTDKLDNMLIDMEEKILTSRFVNQPNSEANKHFKKEVEELLDTKPSHILDRTDFTYILRTMKEILTRRKIPW